MSRETFLSPGRHGTLGPHPHPLLSQHTRPPAQPGTTAEAGSWKRQTDPTQKCDIRLSSLGTRISFQGMLHKRTFFLGHKVIYKKEDIGSFGTKVCRSEKWLRLEYVVKGGVPQVHHLTISNNNKHNIFMKHPSLVCRKNRSSGHRTMREINAQGKAMKR